MQRIHSFLLQAAAIIRKQKEEIKRLQIQLDSFRNIEPIRIYNEAVANKAYYDTLLNPEIILKGSKEGYSDEYATSAKNIIYFTTVRSESNAFLCKTVLLKPVESRNGKLPSTNEIVHRNTLDKHCKHIDKAGFFMAKISSHLYVNLEFFDMYTIKGQTYLKCTVRDIVVQKNEFIVKPDFKNLFIEAKERHKRISELYDSYLRDIKS